MYYETRSELVFTALSGITLRFKRYMSYMFIYRSLDYQIMVVEITVTKTRDSPDFTFDG